MAKEQRHDWENWSDEDKRKADKQIEIADAIKLYRSAGGMGVGAQAKPYSDALAASGGLDPDHATQLARYKMYKETTGGDPEWQGPLNINTGPREAPPSADEIAAKREAYFNAGPEERARIFREEGSAVARSREGYFDSLASKKKAPVDTAKTLEDSISMDQPKRRARRG